MKTYLLQREDKLITACRHLDEQLAWAEEHGYKDLCPAYVAGQRLLLDQLNVIQSILREMKEQQP